MQAENTLLTHFSARYFKMPKHSNEPRSPSDKDAVVAVAFDHCKVRIGEMAKLRAYLPAIEQTMHDSPEDDDEVDEIQVPW